MEHTQIASKLHHDSLAKRLTLPWQTSAERTEASSERGVERSEWKWEDSGRPGPKAGTSSPRRRRSEELGAEACSPPLGRATWESAQSDASDPSACSQFHRACTCDSATIPTHGISRRHMVMSCAPHLADAQPVKGDKETWPPPPRGTGLSPQRLWHGVRGDEQKRGPGHSQGTRTAREDMGSGWELAKLTRPELSSQR